MSLNAELVAKDVLLSVKRGERINMYKLAVKNGYSPKTAKNSKEKIVEQPSYQAIMIPAIKRMEQIRDKALLALDNKDLALEDTRVLKELAESLTKQLQLLTGKATENIATTVTMVNYADLPPEPRTSEVVQPNDTVIADGKDIDISE